MLLTGGCLLLHESSAESSCMSFLHYFHAAISNHLSEKPKNMSCFTWPLDIGLTVFTCSCLYGLSSFVDIDVLCYNSKVDNLVQISVQ